MRQEVKGASPRFQKIPRKPLKGKDSMLIVRGEKELKRRLFIRALKDLVEKLKKLLRKK